MISGRGVSIRGPSQYASARINTLAPYQYDSVHTNTPERINTTRRTNMTPAVPIRASLTSTPLGRTNTPPYPYASAPISTLAACQYAPFHINTHGPYQYDPAYQYVCLVSIRPYNISVRPRVSIQAGLVLICVDMRILNIVDWASQTWMTRARLDCASGVLFEGFRRLKTHQFGCKPRKLRNSKYLTRISMSGCRKRSKMNQKHRFPLGSLPCTSKHRPPSNWEPESARPKIRGRIDTGWSY